MGETAPTDRRHDHSRSLFDRFSGVVTRATGTSAAFMIAFAVIVIWALTGPICNFSDTWQLAINTSTTIVTFLMVFVIQQSQNKDTLAVHLKLNELIACSEKANNRLVVVEDLSPEELKVLKAFYVKLSALADNDDDVHQSHSLNEADDLHKEKLAAARKDHEP